MSSWAFSSKALPRTKRAAKKQRGRVVGMARFPRFHGFGNGTGAAQQYLYIGHEKRAHRLLKSLGTYFSLFFVFETMVGLKQARTQSSSPTLRKTEKPPKILYVDEKGNCAPASGFAPSKQMK